jgi:hypothetical protein
MLLIGCEAAASGEQQLECASSEGADATFCDDFNEGEADAWSPEGGSWTVVDGRYVGEGPMEVGGDCGASLMTASYREGSEATDLSMHVELAAEARLDKTIVLRASDAANRIELNFRGAPINDLIVQELVGCEVVYHSEEGEIAVEQPEGEPIAVDIELEGQHLRVIVDDELVIDRDYEFANTGEGRVGVAVIDQAITTFDSAWMTRR